MRALVTGASGFVGRFLIEHLLQEGDTVLATDARAPELRGLHSPQLSCAPLDITDKNACITVLGDFRPDATFHLAGISFVPDAESDFERTLRINVGGVANLYAAAHALRYATTIVLVSSAEVYGRIHHRDLPISETVPLRPANNYGLSKAMAELIPKRYGSTLISTVVMRPFNHIGPGQRPEFVVSSFAEQLAKIACNKSEPRLRVGNLDAGRDFCDVRDIVRAYRSASLKAEGVYNLCSGHATRIREVLDLLIEISGVTIEVVSDPSRMRPAEIPLNFGTAAKAKEHFDWEPRISLRQSLSDVYAWWKGSAS